MTSGFSLYLDEVPIPSTTPATVNGKYYHNTMGKQSLLLLLFCFSLVFFNLVWLGLSSVTSEWSDLIN